MAETTGEWKGSTSAKFTTNRKHLPAPEAPLVDHPLYSMGSKRHFDARYEKEAQWKNTVKTFPDKDAPREQKPHGVKYLNPSFTQPKNRPERLHSDNGKETTLTYEDAEVGKKTYITHNRKTTNEVGVSKLMGGKQRVNNLYD